MNDSMAGALGELVAALEKLKIRYAIGGSLASSAHGTYRATADGDIVAAIAPAHARQLAATLGRDWYADEEVIERALREGRSFNLIHIKTAMKFDVFPARTDFHRTQLQRAVVTPLLQGALSCQVTTAEDILLAKLRWYADSGEVSDRQWNDIVGLLATNPELDAVYVAHWASELGVTRLLERAQADARKE
jgi:hypothetical protein